MKLLLIVPYPKGKAASQRFRFEQYLELLDQENIDYKFSSFWDEKAWALLYQKGKVVGKFISLLRGLFRRFALLFTAWKYDVFFIHREVYPVGIPMVEWFLSKVVRKRIIYDFDDAIWIPNYAENNKKFAFLKSYRHVGFLCKNSTVVSTGNKFLQNFAKEYNQNAIVNPTTIDTVNHHNKTKDHSNDSFVLGWTGTHSTLRYLEQMLPFFKKLRNEVEFELVVISDQDPKFELKGFKFIKWEKSSEIEDLLSFNVGLMPLSEDRWSSGKCGFKALQYMSLGIPAIVSPVGVNSEIVDHGLNGYICSTEAEWERAIKELSENRALLIDLGKSAKTKIVDNYSVISNSNNFLSLFK